jgi:Domain of unknown function (DUF1707)
VRRLGDNAGMTRDVSGGCGVAGPGDEIAAGTAGRGRLRASHADREQVIDNLKAAFAQGRLAKEEFEARIGEALVSRTYAELAAVVCDVPAGPPVARPSKPARAQDLKPVPRPGPVIMASSTLYAGLWALALFVPSEVLDGVLAPTLALLTVFILAGMIGLGIARLASRHQERSRGQLPRRPASGPGGRASGRLPSADPADRLPPTSDSQQNIARTSPGRRPRPRRSGSGPSRRWCTCGLLGTGEMIVAQ